jgi:hypothetical protein
MEYTLEKTLGGMLTEGSHVFGEGEGDALDKGEKALSDREEGALADEIGDVETHRKAMEMLEIVKAATPIGKGTPDPGAAREGWHIVRLSDGWSLRNEVPYIGDLVFGTAPHLITSNASSVINENPFGTSTTKPLSFLKEGSQMFAMSVQHPGSNPIQGLRAAWDDAYVHGQVTGEELQRDLLGFLPRVGVF